jgi:putative acetyltransferase
MTHQSSNFKIVAISSPDHLQIVKKLFLEYAQSLDFNLCFQNFENEYAGLPGEYAPPGGMLLLALADDSPAGCVALRRIDASACEMKRMYVRTEYRGCRYGRKLAGEVIQRAKEIGYTTMRLDTVPSMKEAIALYRSLGFREILPYRENPVAGAIFMELNLKMNNG